ncbi:hypothetical protein B0H13DRAFT_1938393 [Mycena leptocephala]|nr:hypothetical protein B0H13DRAFT_1938393 [Mycena leptocephala]
MSDNAPQSNAPGTGREIAPTGYTGSTSNPQQGAQPNGGAQNQPPAGSGGPGAGSGQNVPDGGNPQGGQPTGDLQNRAPAGSSGPSAGGDGGASQGQNQGLPAAAQSALSDCELVVEEYRRQRINKAKALHEIYQKLIGAGVGDNLDIEAAFSSFLKAVDDVDHQHNSAADRGHARGPAETHGNAAPGVRRSLSPPVLERPGGRSGALEAQYPWAITKPSAFSRSCCRTQRSRSALVNGRSINLDAVLSGMFSTSTTDERSEALGGGLELRFGAVAPARCDFVRFPSSRTGARRVQAVHCWLVRGHARFVS